MRNEIVNWRGAQIATSVTGSGPPLILCHGTPFSSIVWDPVIPELEQVTEVYRWDMPGYGASTQAEGVPVDLDSQAQALAGLIARWGLDCPPSADLHPGLRATRREDRATEDQTP